VERGLAHESGRSERCLHVAERLVDFALDVALLLCTASGVRAAAAVKYAGSGSMSSSIAASAASAVASSTAATATTGSPR
jgi:hypothetical protein